MTANPMSQLGTLDPHRVRVYVGKVTAVDTAAGTCTFDLNDGDPLAEVPYVGAAPGVGSVQLGFLFDELLMVLVAGSGGGGGAAESEVAISGSAPTPVANLPELWLDTASTGVTDDTGWVNLTPTSGTGIMRYRVIGKWVNVQSNLSGFTSIAAGGNASVVTPANALPVPYRPIGLNAYGAGNGGGSNSLSGVVNVDGSVSVLNHSAVAVTTVRMNIVYAMET